MKDRMFISESWADLSSTCETSESKCVVRRVIVLREDIEGLLLLSSPVIMSRVGQELQPGRFPDATEI